MIRLVSDGEIIIEGNNMKHSDIVDLVSSARGGRIYIASQAGQCFTVFF
jgi:glutamate synthase domain-containing protein 3